MDAVTEHDSVKENLLIEGLQDWIYLNEVHQQFASAEDTERAPDEVQQLTLNMIRELVSENSFELGSPAGPKRNPHFQPWDLPLDDAMTKIEEAYLSHYDDRRNWMTVCWLNLTQQGEKLALERYHADDPK